MNRPLARYYNGRFIAATPPDREKSWKQKHKNKTITITAQFWDDPILRAQKPGAANFNVVAIHDPTRATRTPCYWPPPWS